MLWGFFTVLGKKILWIEERARRLLSENYNFTSHKPTGNKRQG